MHITGCSLRRWKRRTKTKPQRAMDEETKAPEGRRRGWTSIWLSTPVLLALLLSFLISATSLAVFVVLSRRSNSIRAIIDIHYAWTYSPTALFILFTAFWRQIDFHCKQVAPWAVLDQKEASASDSVLLDYISPIQPTAFLRSIHHRHGAVIASSFGFIMLKGLTVASTALFTSKLVPNVGVASPLQKFSFTDRLTGDTSVTSIGSGSTYEAFGVSSQGLPYRYGMQDSFLYERLELPAGMERRNGSLIAAARALVPQFECQSAPFKVIFPPVNTTDFNPETQVELLFPECTLRGGDGRGTAIYSLNPSTTRVPSRQLSPLRQRVDCLNQSTEYWELLTLVDFRYQQELTATDQDAALGDNVRASSWFTTVESTTGVVCRSSYALREANLGFTFSDRGDSELIATLQPRSNLTSLQSFTSSDVGNLTDSALFAASSMPGGFTDNAFEEDYPNVMFKLMTAIVNGTYSALTDETTMIKAAERSYQQVALQSLDRYLRNNTSATAAGTYAATSHRLFINEAAAIGTVVGLGLVCITTVALLFVAPRNVVQNDPSLLASAASTLHDSPLLNTILTEAKVRNTKLKDALVELHFASSLSHTQISELSQGILISKSTRTSVERKREKEPKEKPRHNTHWYKPITTKRTCLVLFMVLCLAIIASLEATQSVSDRNNGIAIVSNPESQILRLLPQVLTATIMLCVAAAFSSIEFNTLLLAPMQILSRGTPKSSNAMWLSYLGNLPVSVLLSSLRRGHWPVLLAVTSSLIGSFLTIIASGLFTLEEFTVSGPIAAEIADNFQVTWTDSVVNDNDAAIVQSLVESTDIGYPAFVYDELAFPTVQHSLLQTHNESENARLEIELPAMRAGLDCTTLDTTQYNLSASFNSRILTSRAELSASIPLPGDCQRGGPTGDGSTLDFNAVITMSSNASYFGRLLDLHVGPWTGAIADSTGELDPRRQPDNPASCPTLAFVYGHASQDNPAETAATVLVCYQQLHTVSTTTTFTLPNMSISARTAPVPDLSTLTTLSYPNTTSSNLPYRPQLHFTRTFRSLDQFTPFSPQCSFRAPTAESRNTTFDSTNPVLDPFFQGVLCARQNYLPVETLALTDTASRSRVFASIQAFYRRYMAIAVSKNMRVPLTPSDSGVGAAAAAAPQGKTVQGKIINARKETRVVQHRTPKWILQGMLTAMVLLGAASVWMSKLWRPVVQWNPCSVAGFLGICAGSTIVRDGLWGSRPGGGLGARNRDGLTKKEVKQRLAGWRLRLGWVDGGTAAVARDGGLRRNDGQGAKHRVWTIEMVREGPKAGAPRRNEPSL